jgi:predicted nucleic acid-binding protein
MNLYIDTSALIKVYVEETDSEAARNWILNASVVATGLITRAEVSSGINRVYRMRIATKTQYKTALSDFRRDWEYFHRIPITEQIVARADFLICQHVLRGYDAVHLACALAWQEILQTRVTLATFDSQLRDAAREAGLFVLPE